MILGFLLCSLVIARGNLTVQKMRSDSKIEADRVLDELLTRWWQEKNPYLFESTKENQGQIKGSDRYTWKILPITHAPHYDTVNASSLNATKIALRKVRVILLNTKTQSEATSIELAMPIDEISVKSGSLSDTLPTEKLTPESKGRNRGR